MNQPPRQPQQSPPAFVRGGDELRPGLKTKSATILSMFIHSALFVLTVSPVLLVPVGSPAGDHLLRIIVMVASSVAFYVANYFVFGERFWGLPLRVLLTNQVLLLHIAIEFSGHIHNLKSAALFSSIAFMFYILIAK